MTPSELEAIALPQLEVLYRVARRMVSNGGESEVEDLVGDTLCAAFRSCHECDGKYPVAWMIKIMGFRAMRLWSRPDAAESLDDQLREPVDPGAHHRLLAQLQNLDVLRALDQLPLQYRLAVALVDMEEMEYEEAAQALGVPVGTVRSRLSRGRKLLQRSLMAYGQPEESGK